MDQPSDWHRPEDVASTLDAEICALPVQNTPNIRAIRRKYSKSLKQAEAGFVLDVAKEFLDTY